MLYFTCPTWANVGATLKTPPKLCLQEERLPGSYIPTAVCAMPYASCMPTSSAARSFTRNCSPETRTSTVCVISRTVSRG